VPSKPVDHANVSASANHKQHYSNDERLQIRR
jgi:hypothetical protein